MNKRSVRDLDVPDKRVLVRVDFNVPVKDGEVTDDTRIRRALPTIRHLLEEGARPILISHLGRPKGEPDPKYAMDPVAARLQELLGEPVKKLDAAVGPEVVEVLEDWDGRGVVLLENSRFYPGETSNDPGFADQLAALADLYVNDAFGAAHRAHATTVGVAERLPAAAGLLMEEEEDYLEEALRLMEEAGDSLVLPVDVVVAEAMEKAAESETVASSGIPSGKMGLDIGPETVALFERHISGANTIFWNGPMGVFEIDAFAKGTEGVARAVAESGATSVVGGGDSVAAVNKLGLEDRMSHISTGGGASLEYVEGKELPGIAVLPEK